MIDNNNNAHIQTKSQDNLVKLSTGVVLSINSIPQDVMIDLWNNNPEPQPPYVFMKSIGRNEYNKDDPEYLEAHNKWQMSMYSNMVDLYILWGTQVVDIPENIMGPNSERWHKRYKSTAKRTGLDPDDEDDIYIYWVRYIACQAYGKNKDSENSDISKIVDKISAEMGISEGMVKEEEEKFRDNS